MDMGYYNMNKQVRVEMLVGMVTLAWSIVAAVFKQPIIIDELSGIMPGAYWVFSGVVIGGAQIYISRNPDRWMGTFSHWCVAFFSCIFWCYLGMAAQAAAIGVLPVLIFWSTAGVTLWELAHVRT